MNQKGFSLIEVMIVIAIISILSAIAIPTYQGYMQKAAMTDVLQTILPYKNSIEICSVNQGALSSCNSGSENIPSNIKGKYIKSIDVKSGIITFIADKSLSGLSAKLTPSIPVDGSSFQWQVACESKVNDKLKSLCERTFIF
ncbi:prepilin peptidase-dependent pilin [Providencia burhodogranariea]|uniref:Putative major pilin subunit n=1 Tax=Providencia burhodogranariea DSM 19968 TaxID=1141662 RepID=K8X543_9GAMM|nr:prepilin peptidase-dependent pilin [Providencia burhodogranariea]EKT64792.1 putative major pilin subunit [Providencia burhodogranariea DSM 19968]